MEYQLSQESYRPPISGDQSWLFRCAVLHQARGKQSTTETTRLAFIEPGSTTVSVHVVGVRDGSGHTVLQMDLSEFCRTMVQAAVGWLDANRDNPTIEPCRGYDRISSRSWRNRRRPSGHLTPST